MGPLKFFELYSSLVSPTFFLALLSLLKSSWALARLCKKATDSLLQLNEIFNKNSSSKVRAGNLHAWGHGLELLGITHGLVK